MTVNNELVRIGDSIIHNGPARLWLPEYIMPEYVNSEIPSERELFKQSSIQKYPIGAQLAKNANLWRYCLAGAAMGAEGFLKGNYTQCPGKAGNSASAGFEGALYTGGVSEGDTSFKIADTAAAKNLYAGAMLVIYDTTNGFQQYRVLGNDVSTGVYTVLYIAAPGFKNDTTTSPGITVYLNPYRNIRAMTGGYMSALGYGRFDITSAYFFWLVTAGPVSCVTGASTWPGQTQYYRDVYSNTDGSLIGYTAGYQRIGYLLGRTATDYGDNHIMLELDKEGAI